MSLGILTGIYRAKEPYARASLLALGAQVIHSQFTAGDIISRYRVLEELGRGGMGVVYKAQDNELGRFVALKVLPDSAARAPHPLHQLRPEARRASALDHHNTCTIYEIGNLDGH